MTVATAAMIAHFTFDVLASVETTPAGGALEMTRPPPPPGEPPLPPKTPAKLETSEAERP